MSPATRKRALSSSAIEDVVTPPRSVRRRTGSLTNKGNSIAEVGLIASPSSSHDVPIPPEEVAEDDLYPICHLLLYRPVTTLCKHTACESCMARWADFSISPEMTLLPITSSEPAEAGSLADEVKCPMCRACTSATLDVDKDGLLRVRYPRAYQERQDDAERNAIARPEGEGEGSIETVTLFVGNTHKLRTSREETPDVHQWSFFVRPSNTEMIEEVRMLLHPAFRPPCVHCREPPYEVTRVGRGSFTIVVLVILKIGYTWVSEDAVASPDGYEKNMLPIDWTLDFHGEGSQGRLRMKVKKEPCMHSCCADADSVVETDDEGEDGGDEHRSM